MKRKVNLVGPNTLTVSLPIQWVKENHINKGDELFTLIDKDKITFSVSEKKPVVKEVTITIDKHTYHSLSRYLTILYRTNYNRIILIYSESELYHNKKGEKVNLKKLINKIVERLVGAEIVSQSATKTEIECFITEKTKELDKIEKRIYFLLKETTDQLLEATKGNFKEFNETLYDHHDNITKFINYFLRMLYESDRSEEEKKAGYAFYTFIDTMVDKIRHLGEKIEMFGCTPKIKKYLQEVLGVFYGQFDALGKKQLSPQVIEERYKLKKRIDKENLSIKELRVLQEIYIFLETINVFSEYIIAKNLSKNE